MNLYLFFIAQWLSATLEWSLAVIHDQAEQLEIIAELQNDMDELDALFNEIDAML